MNKLLLIYKYFKLIIKEAFSIKHKSSLIYRHTDHFYSPLVNVKQIKENADKIYNFGKILPDIDNGESRQLELLESFRSYYSELPFHNKSVKSLRYYYDNGLFSYADAIILYSVLRHFKPKQLVEIGSGFSSAVMLDTGDLFFNSSIKYTFIEPYPDRLNELLKKTDDNKQVISKPVQVVDDSVFLDLKDGDILFIDSSHVVKTASDVNYIYFHILPLLSAGVLIHIHDIFWPFEYPISWLEEGRCWTESYLLRSLLQNSDTYKIIYFNSFMHKFHSDKIEKCLPLCLKNSGGSIWLTKV